MLKESNISKLNLLSSIVLITIFSFIMLYISIYHQNEEFKSNIKKIEVDYLNSQKELLKSRVDEIVNYIEYEKSKIKKLSKEEIEKEVIDRINYMRFNQNGYFFILDRDGNVIFHPFMEIGENVLNLKDIDGKYFVKEFLKVNKKNEGYVEYKWKKINSDEISKKISFVKMIKEWGWFIGAGIYMDEIKNEIDQRRKVLEDRINEEVKLYLLLLTLFIIVAISISILFSKSIEKILKAYKLKVELKEKELNELNISLEGSVKEKTKELLKLNQTLELKVKTEVEKNRQKDRVMFQQSRFAQMGEMVGNIAHQWRQPLHELNLILESFEIAFLQNSLNEKFINDRLSKGEEVINKMSQVINDFRNFFNPNKKKILFMMEEAINGSIAMISASFKNHSIKILKDIKSYKILGHQNEFEQVILNILSNAKDVLLTKPIEKRVLFITSEIENNFYILKIYDSGGGVDGKIIDKVFNPYFTTKEQGKGTGIGLYMSKAIIDNMGGELSVENLKFKICKDEFFGACFIIKLPIKY